MDFSKLGYGSKVPLVVCVCICVCACVFCGFFPPFADRLLGAAWSAPEQNVFNRKRFVQHISGDQYLLAYQHTNKGRHNVQTRTQVHRKKIKLIEHPPERRKERTSQPFPYGGNSNACRHFLAERPCRGPSAR